MQMQGMGMQEKPSIKDRLSNAFYGIKNKVSNIKLFNRNKNNQDMQAYYDEQAYNQGFYPQRGMNQAYPEYNNQQDYYNNNQMYQDPYQQMAQNSYNQQPMNQMNNAYNAQFNQQSYQNNMNQQYANPYAQYQYTQQANPYAYQEEAPMRSSRRPQARMTREQNAAMQDLKGGIKGMAQMREQEEHIEAQYEQFAQSQQQTKPFQAYAPNNMNQSSQQFNEHPMMDQGLNNASMSYSNNPLSNVHIKVSVITNPQDCMRMLQLIVQPCVCIVSMENITDSAIRRICESMIVGARCVLNYKSIQLTSSNIFVMVPEEVQLDMNEHAKNLLNRFSNMRSSASNQAFKAFDESFDREEQEYRAFS